jgi:hypothetical protein
VAGAFGIGAADAEQDDAGKSDKTPADRPGLLRIAASLLNRSPAPV